jgi:hypothetical protein
MTKAEVIPFDLGRMVAVAKLVLDMENQKSYLDHMKAIRANAKKLRRDADTRIDLCIACLQGPTFLKTLIADPRWVYANSVDATNELTNSLHRW